jgi:succinate dehydrogenase/fumarate reductase flavoprotein subunit
VDQGEDKDFARFSPSDAQAREMSPKISTPPYYAMRAYPLTRKSMGGVAIDHQCRVLDKQRQPIKGLYAVGELTGLALINGKAALEGTFLGPCIVTGRIAGKAIAAELRPHSVIDQPESANSSCIACHNLPQLLTKARPGFWHFEKVHSPLAKRDDDCAKCHQELIPYRAEHHRIDQRQLAKTCIQCHVAQE